MPRRVAACALLLGVALVPARLAAAGPAVTPPGLGVPVGEADVARFALTVFPDGRNLPPGGGDARTGAALYRETCAACHGASGTEGPAPRLAGSDGLFGWTDPLRILRVRDNPMLVTSLGGRWPYATTVFDYVRRAMPHVVPKSLTSDQAYALTALVLHLNGLVDLDTRLDATTLPHVAMPARERAVALWPPAAEAHAERPACGP